MTVKTEPLTGNSGMDAGGGTRGEKRRVSEKLVTHPRNTPSKVPGVDYFCSASDFAEFFGPSLVSMLPTDISASVFFGTSGVPGDGYAAESSTSVDFGLSVAELREIEYSMPPADDPRWRDPSTLMLVDRPAMWFWHEPGDVSLTKAQHAWVLDHGGFHVFHIQKGLGTNLETFR